LDDVVGLGPISRCDVAPGGRCSVTRRAARRAERGALDRRRAGASWCVRAGADAYLGPRPGLAIGVGDMMVMGFPAGGRGFAAAQSLEAVHANVAAAQCRELATVHR
jgi:hypothetical protein